LHLALPDGADIDKAHAVYRDGLLEIATPVAMAKPAGRRLVVENLGFAKKSKEVP
jgi:HSP20 family molecular chaperone IbpA